MTRSAAAATWSPNQDRTTGNTRGRGRRLGPRYALGLGLGLALACNAERPGDGSPAERGEEAAEPSADERTADRMMDDGMMGDMHERMMGGQMQMPDWMMSEGMMMDRTMMRDMHVIHGLLSRHDAIRREVELIPGGVRTRTASEDPEVAALIRAHVGQMKSRIEEGRPIRHMDPLFREIFEHHDAIQMQVRNVPGGVVVTEMSDDPRVVALIRQHATRAVSEFVAEGMPRAMRPTPLPEDNEPEAPPSIAAAGGG